MLKPENFGVYLFNSKNSSPDAVDYPKLTDYLKNYPGSKFVQYLGDDPAIDIQAISEEIKREGVDRIIIGGDTPGVYKDSFTKAMKKAGKGGRNVHLACFNDHGASAPNSTKMAKAVLLSAIYNIPFETALMPDENRVNKESLIIGAGIAGIQAALEIANGGYKVYLVEKSGTIGGHMAMFDKTFPTLDCAACILTPKMVEVGQHPNIEILHYSEVKKVEGESGDFQVTVHKKALRVDPAKCITCGDCADICPKRVPSEFDAGTALRKAIYIPFPQAVPNKYLVDGDNCLYVQNGKCGVCVKKCPTEAINLDEQDQEITLNVGNIIVATGYQPFDARRAEKYGYGLYPNVITSLEFERLVNAAGPTGGNLKLKTLNKKGEWIFSGEGEDPKSVAIVHCIGSRDENYNKYCSRVCCMYSLKFAHLVKEKLPDAEVYEYYIDMRAFGKGYEEFYERIKNEGINVIRGKTAKVEESNGKLLVRSENITAGRLEEQECDLVILSIGLEPRKDAGEIARMLGISQSPDGWFLENNITTATTETFTGGISIAGVCQGPKDIPDSVAQGSAAASKVLMSIMKGTVKKNIKDVSLEDIELKGKTFHK